MPATPKILLLVENNGFPRDFRVRREAHALRDYGFQVSVVCPREGTERWHEIVDDVEIYRFPAPPGGSGLLSYAFEFAYSTLVMLMLSLWVALRRGVDVVHAANPPDTLFVVGAVFRLLGKRYIFDHHDLAPEIYLSRLTQPRRDLAYACLALMERCSYAVANVVISTNESYRQRAIKDGRKLPEKVFVVRNGPPRSYQLLEPPLGLAERAKHLIGYIGTIGPQDGVDFWLRSIHYLAGELGRDDFLAIVIGDGDALEGLRALTRELDIERYVHFTGRLSEYESRRHLSAVHVCVQPDPSSPLNDKSTMNKLMEYMALGKPTVAYDLLETRVSGGEAVAYVEPNDEYAFAEKVRWLLDNPDARARMGDIGRERVAEALSWEHSVPVLLRAYREGLGLLPRLQSETV